MAEYNREFLLPFLQDVCAMQWAVKQLEEQYGQVWQSCNQWEKIEPGQYPAKESFDPVQVVCWVAPPFMIVLVCLVTALLSSRFGFSALLPVLAGLVLGVAVSIPGLLEMRREKRRIEGRYAADLAKYRKCQEAYEQAQHRLPELYRRRDASWAALAEARALLGQCYGVGVIPTQCWGIIPATYLYQYVCSRKEERIDLHAALEALKAAPERWDTNSAAWRLAKTLFAQACKSARDPALQECENTVEQGMGETADQKMWKMHLTCTAFFAQTDGQCQVC